MLLGQTMPYKRLSTGFRTAAGWGASVAHQELARAVMSHCDVDGVEFFLLTDEKSADMDAALAELRCEFPEKVVSLRRMDEVLDCAGRGRYTFPVELGSVGRLAQARARSLLPLFPIAGITHAIVNPTQVGYYIDLLLFLEHHDVIVATSRAGQVTINTIKDCVAQLLNRDISSRLSDVETVRIPLGVDDTFFEAQNKRLCRQQMNLPQESVILLYLGRFSETYKADLEPLISVFANLRTLDSRVKLVLAGRETQLGYCEAIRAIVRRLNLSESVHILADFPVEQKRQLYGCADIFVSPVDNLQETFGLSIVEAMASGLPTVASNWSGYRDLVRHGTTGFLVRTLVDVKALEDETIDSCLRQGLTPSYHRVAQRTIIDTRELYQFLYDLVANDALRSQLGSQGRNLALGEYSWGAVARRFQDMWREQWRRIVEGGHSQRRSKSIALGDYLQSFGHFASARLSDAMIVSIGRNAEERAAERSAAGDGVAHDDAILALLNKAARAPYTIEELVSSTALTRGEVVRLIKKGYLELHNA